MKRAEEIIGWGNSDYIHWREVVKAIGIAQKEAATEFFKWHWRNYSSHPNPEEILERYDEFIKEVG